MKTGGTEDDVSGAGPDAGETGPDAGGTETREPYGDAAAEAADTAAGDGADDGGVAEDGAVASDEAADSADVGDGSDGGGDATGGGSSPGRRRIRNAVAALLIAALIVNLLAVLPRIYNLDTLPLLFRSRQLAEQEEIRRALDAVVLISTNRSRGSGFHVSGGYILTNHHVVEDAAWLLVEFPGAGRFPAEVAEADPALDIALLKADIGEERLPFIEIERNWEPGETVYVVGNPLYLERIAASGSILGTARVQGRSAPVMIVDAPVRRGNSGSPVVNGRGRAVAVIYAAGEVMHRGEPVQAGFAVPIGELDGLLGQWLPGR
ncbi:S1C family serine protease [Thermobacillus sp. ZCTH02-B1]|uniref:S1C family serine protease n=1 Tax=Thermobacillus sp. ZCTH02-B1 TaxID=1858795 RepID=UPI0025DF67D5|nr:serine protease [Thermobacillus sp. ZCTH02-B1]